MASLEQIPVDHVVVLMMENNSFDRMLGCMAEIRPGLDGVDPQRPATNPDGAGGVVAQTVTRTRNVERDPMHYLPNSLAQLDGGTNQGFVADFARTHPNATAEERAEVMACYPRGFLPALHMLAEQGVICDRWHSSMPGPTWMNRLFAHTGTSQGRTSEPGGLFSSGLHLYDERTLYDELTDNGVDWRIYFGDVPQSLVLTHQLAHLGRYHRFAFFKDDVAAGRLPAYAFIEPTYFGPGQNDQHPPHDVMRGDALIADVYNALQASPDVFARTLLIVLYDEHGGFFDHVAPPGTVAPDDLVSEFAFDVLGFRVPAVLVSPMLDPGLSSVLLDHTSLLRMASALWPGVRPLGRRAAQANDPLAGLAWRTSPRPMPPAPYAPDIQPARAVGAQTGFKASLLGLTHHLESLIPHAPARGALLARAHELLEGGAGQARLAAARAASFFEHHEAPAASALRRAVESVRERVGL